MIYLIAGIIIFLGAHTLPTLRPTRDALIGAIGANGYRGLHSVVSLIGFVLLCYGFGQYRAHDWVQVWTPPAMDRHITMLLMWFAFISLAAMGKRPGRIRGWLRHPMLVAIKIWALAHLLANGDLGGMILFGSFLAWAVWDRISLKHRGDLGAARLDRFTRAAASVLVAGTVAYVAMLFLHPLLIGVAVLR